MIRWLAAALAALFLATAPAAAQTIGQSGTVSPGHLGAWVTSGLLKDAGSPSNFQANALGLYNGANSPLAISSQTASGSLPATYCTLALGATTANTLLTGQNQTGGPCPLNISIGGTIIPIGGANWLSTNFDSQFCTTQGSVLYRNGTVWTCLPPGSSGQVLQTQGPNLNPQWAGSGGIGTVTSITAGAGLSGGTITTSGTIALLNPVAVNLGGTGAATLAAHGVLLGNGTTAVNVATPGVAGTVLQSNGAGADPTWNAVAGTGTVTSITAGSTRLTVSPSPLVTSGTIDCATATSSQIGCSKPDGTTITASAGTLTTANTTVAGVTCTPGSSCLGSSYTAPTSCSITDGSGASLSITTNYCSYSVFNNVVTLFASVTYPSTADINNAALVMPVAIPNNTELPVVMVQTSSQAPLLGVLLANTSKLALYSFNTAGGTALSNANRSTTTMAFCAVYPKT